MGGKKVKGAAIAKSSDVLARYLHMGSWRAKKGHRGRQPSMADTTKRKKR